MLRGMGLRAVAVAFLFVACSGSAPRVQPPAPSPSAPQATSAPAAVPAVTPAASTLSAITVADWPGFGFADPARRQKLEAALPGLDKLVADEMQRQGLPGIALGVVIDGDLVWAKGFGVVSPATKTVPDADTVYRIGSITKSFTGLALLSLRDEGALRLDDPLATWLPEANGLVYPTSDSARITLRQLSNHTSGLPRDGTFDAEAAPTDQIVLRSLAGLALESAPGTRWSYSNLGFGLLGMVVARAAHSPLRDVIGARILTPLGMTSTVWDATKVPAGRLAPAFVPSPDGPMPNPKPARLGAIEGAGAIYSSVRDMAKYVAFQMSAYPPRSDADGGVIKRATLREAHSTGVPSGFKSDPPAVAMSYGFGWSQFSTCELDDLVTHNGAIESYRADIRFSPSRGVGIVALTNFGNGNPSAVAEQVMTALAKTGALEPRAARPSRELTEAVRRLLTIYEHWDEAKLASFLSRPVDPREQQELATYHQLHGACTTFEPTHIDTPTSGSFAVKCERGTFELQVVVTGKGLIQGFTGTSRGIEAPPAITKAGRAIVALQQKWNDKTYATYLAKTPIKAAVLKPLTADFRKRHGSCKISGALHSGFDWGFALACTKENVELWLPSVPGQPLQLVGLLLRPPPGTPKQCAQAH